MAEKIACQKCGKELGPSVRFCGMCGTPVERPGNAPDSKPQSEFERLLDEVESGFESIVQPSGEAPAANVDPAKKAPTSDPTGEVPMDATMARALFDSMVVEHARPIRDFMIEVRLGEPLRAWVDFAMPALRVVLRSSQGMGFNDFVEKLAAFLDALELAQRGSDRLIRGQLRQAIIDTYSDLTAFMPDAFALEQEANRREAIIVHSLLQQVPGLQKVGIDRIYSAGLTSLALFYVARPTDIAELTGIPIDLAENVVTRFREYRRKTESLSPEGDRAAELALLRQQADQLDAITAEYDRLAPGMVGDVKRRELRRARGELMVEIGLLMARLGEVTRLRELEKLPFSARTEQIRAFLDETKRKATAAGGAHV